MGRAARCVAGLKQALHTPTRAWMLRPCCIRAVHPPAQQFVSTGELLAGTCVARAASVLRLPHPQQPRGAPSSLQVCATPLPL